MENRIQETDGGYFEAFTALAWKRDNRRMSAVRTAETRAELLPEKEHDGQSNEDFTDTPEEKEQLYIEVLQTIANSVGAPAPGGQVCTLIPLSHFERCDDGTAAFLSINIYHCSICRATLLDLFHP